MLSKTGEHIEDQQIITQTLFSETCGTFQQQEQALAASLKRRKQGLGVLNPPTDVIHIN